jgi:hypothetical protein
MRRASIVQERREKHETIHFDYKATAEERSAKVRWAKKRSAGKTVSALCFVPCMGWQFNQIQAGVLAGRTVAGRFTC